MNSATLEEVIKRSIDRTLSLQPTRGFKLKETQPNDYG